jgi:uncharacterized protein
MSERRTSLFASPWAIVIAGVAIGGLAALLQLLGNPPNMGICVACFLRDTTGALGLHRTETVQYIRPEIIGMVLGATVAALAFKEFKARAGSAPIVRLLLGALAMIGALTFLGCPWRALLRLAGGDLNALVGIAGLAGGIAVGVLFLKRGFSLGRSNRIPAAAGWIMPVLMVGLLLLAVIRPIFTANGPIFSSAAGPGSLHALLLVSLGVGLVIGFVAQRTRFCTVGATRDLILMRDPHLMWGVLALVVTTFAINLVFGKVRFGFAAQPIAHSNHLWNFLGMVLAGLAFTLAGGCPGRQLFLSGEGDGDSAVFVLGMVLGAAFSHNFGLAGSPDKLVDGVLTVGGVKPVGMIAVGLGIAVCVVLGLTMREKIQGGAR